MQTICTSFQTDNHTNTSSLTFYTLDALPDTNRIKALKAIQQVQQQQQQQRPFNGL